MQKDKIILFEEPETNLHARLQRGLLDFIKKECKSRQIILTTHSPIFSNFDIGVKLYLTNKGKDGLLDLKNIDSVDDLRNVKECLGLENTDLFHNKFFLIVEGESEERALPQILKKEGLGLSELGIKLINLRGVNKGPNLKMLLRYIKDFDIVPFIITDDDSSVKAQVEDLERSGLMPLGNSFILEGKEFEDCFSSDKVIEVCGDIYGELFTLSIEDLDAGKGEGKKTSKIISKHIEEKSIDGIGPERKIDVALKLIEDVDDENEFYKKVKDILTIIQS